MFFRAVACYARRMTSEGTQGAADLPIAKDHLAARFWGEIPVYLFAAAGFAVCAYLWRSKGVVFEYESILLNLQLFVGFLIFLGAPLLIFQLSRARPESPIGWVMEQLREPALRKRVVLGLPVLAICVVIIPAFSTIKSMIPMFVDFTWDETFIAWDRAIFFGHDAWVLLQPVLGYPPVTALVAVIYHLWLLLLYAGILWMAWSPDVHYDTRRAFFLTYATSWTIVGGVMAVEFASVGPVFVEPILGLTDFTAQTDYLRSANEQVPIMVVPVQDMLVQGYFASESGLGKGISAMPSMHIAICVLYWLAAREVSPAHSRFFFWFMIVIWIGSVHTAYHYAVDGLVSLAAVAVLWWMAKLVFAAWDRIPAPFAQPTLRTNTVPAE